MTPTPAGEVLAMLLRRGFRTRLSPADLPFPPETTEDVKEQFAHHLGHYAFRLFLRGAMQEPEGFLPGRTTRYVDTDESRKMAEGLRMLGLAERISRGRYCLVHPTRSFGGTLEWYVARALRQRLGFDTATGVRFGASGVGGDLDVVAAAEGRLVLLELKSSPPRQLDEGEVRAFFDRLLALRPDLALFVMDTALRLEDKVMPMLSEEMKRRSGHEPSPRRVAREVWALSPVLYLAGAKGDLLGNLSRALANGFRSLTPDPIEGRDGTAEGRSRDTPEGASGGRCLRTGHAQSRRARRRS